jgi:hypothetical protein
MKSVAIKCGFVLVIAGIFLFSSLGNQSFALSFNDFINNAPGFNQDTNYNQDFSWTHNPIPISIASTITYAEVKIMAYDVDSDATDTDPKVIFSGRKEVDNIYAYDNGLKTFLGPLIGGSSVWEYTTFTLGSNFYDDIINGLTLYLDSDALGNNPYWVCQIGSSELKGTMVPLPGAFILFGTGLFRLAIYRRN